VLFLPTTLHSWLFWSVAWSPCFQPRAYMLNMQSKEYQTVFYFGLYKILFYFEAFVHESIILLLPTPTCIARTIAMLFHVYCAIYDATPPTPPVYATHHTILVMAISCEGQILFIYSPFLVQKPWICTCSCLIQGSPGGIRYSYSCGCPKNTWIPIQHVGPRDREFDSRFRRILVCGLWHNKPFHVNRRCERRTKKEKP